MEEGKDYSIGHLRAKYLDLANMYFVQGNTRDCAGYIDAFLNTIPDESEAASYIREEFDKVEVIKNNNKKILFDEMKNLGSLEKTDVKIDGDKQINVDNLQDKKVVCWNASAKYGLLYE